VITRGNFGVEFSQPSISPFSVAAGNERDENLFGEIDRSVSGQRKCVGEERGEISPENLIR
jgi:hypothetical protein